MGKHTLLLALVVSVLVLNTTCLPDVSLWNPYVIRSMYGGARGYNGFLIRPVTASGEGIYNFWYGHFERYHVSFVVTRSQGSLECSAIAHWRNGWLYDLTLNYGCP